MLQSCYTALSSLVADWQATQALFARYGPGAELNPLVRLVGPDGYFGPLVLYTAHSCDRWPAWLAGALWAVQTWAVNTHQALGTVVSYPLAVFTWRW